MTQQQRLALILRAIIRAAQRVDTPEARLSQREAQRQLRLLAY